MKKVIQTAIKIKFGKKEKLTLGDLTIKRDWGYAEEYVEAMQIMNRAKKNKDYIICTGKSHSLKSIVKKVFKQLEMNYKDHIIISKDLYRVNEIKKSSGNPLLINKDLGWKSKVNIDKLIKILIDEEIKKQN